MMMHHHACHEPKEVVVVCMWCRCAFFATCILSTGNDASGKVPCVMRRFVLTITYTYIAICTLRAFLSKFKSC